MCTFLGFLCLCCVFSVTYAKSNITSHTTSVNRQQTFFTLPKLPFKILPLHSLHGSGIFVFLTNWINTILSPLKNALTVFVFIVLTENFNRTSNTSIYLFFYHTYIKN